MKKENLLIILVMLICSILGITLVSTHYTTTKTKNNHQIKLKKVASPSYKNWYLSLNNEPLMNSNLGDVEEFTPIADVLVTIVDSYYYGYGWSVHPNGATDTDFEILLNMLYPNKNDEDLGAIATPTELANELYTYQNKTNGGVTKLLNESFINNWATYTPEKTNVWKTSLKPTSVFYLNLQINDTKLNNDVNSLYNLTNQNYFGYNIDPNNEIDPLFTILFGSDPTAPTIQSKASILAMLRTNLIGNLSFLKTYLKTPGVPTKSLNDWVDNSPIKIIFQNQDKRLAIGAKSLFDLISNYYFGYGFTNSSITSDPLFPIVFSSPNNPIPQDQITIFNKLKELKDAACKFLGSYFKNPLQPTADTADLKDGCWLKTELEAQTTQFDYDVNTIYTITTNNYFGYEWGDFSPFYLFMFMPGSNHSQPNQNLVNENKFRINLLFAYQPPRKTSLYCWLVSILQKPGQNIKNPSMNDLKLGSSMQLGLAKQNDDFIADTTSLFNITSNNYFGYGLLDIPDNVAFELFFGANSTTPTVQSPQQIKTTIDSHTTNKSKIYQFLSNYLTNPGISTSKIIDLKNNSWIKIQLNIQNTRLNIDAANLFNIVANSFFGYSMNNSNHSLYQLLFAGNCNDPKLQTHSQMLINLKKMKEQCFSLLNQTLTNVGKTNSTLKIGSWLQKELDSQTTRLTIDASSLANLIDTYYFGYEIMGTNNPLFNILFNGSDNDASAKTTKEIFNSLKEKKAGVYTIIAANIKNPGSSINTLDQLTDQGWLSLTFHAQKNELITFLSTSIQQFYDPFKDAFLGKNFNNKSFVGANYVLLFFNINREGNLTLGNDPIAVANSFANNLIIQLKQNSKFQLPNPTNNQLGSIQGNSVDHWISTLFTQQTNGKDILAGHLANFANYEITNKSTKNNLGLILGITIPLGLITFGVGGYFIWKKVTLEKLNIPS